MKDEINFLNVPDGTPVFDPIKGKTGIMEKSTDKNDTYPIRAKWVDGYKDSYTPGGREGSAHGSRSLYLVGETPEAPRSLPF